MMLPDKCENEQFRDEAAKRIADAHRSVEPDIIAIFRIEAPGCVGDADEPIKLLEVNPNTPLSGIVPVGLAANPASGIDFPSVIVEIHPIEFEQLKQGLLVLPHGWECRAEL